MAETLNRSQQRQRLKQRELVMSICDLFSQELERTSVESIWDLRISISRVKEYLQTTYRTSYKSSLWVYTQLKRYEEELGVQIFHKERNDTDPRDFYLCVHSPFVNFFQKQHLHVGEKIKLANGVYEKITHFAQERSSEEPVRLLLGAGSTIYHLAAIIAERSSTTQARYIIYTHNLGALQRLLNPHVDSQQITVFTPQGKIDPTTYAIVGLETAFFDGVEFDFVIQGTTRLCKGELYVESRDEWNRKRAILSRCTGEKVLVLTKHELADVPLEGIERYGSLTDYDRVVVPRRSTSVGNRKRYELLFDEYASILEPEIISWNYEIFKILKNIDA